MQIGQQMAGAVTESASMASFPTPEVRGLFEEWAKAGDDLILAVDLQGDKGCRSGVSWDANSVKTSEELIYRLETLPLIAEKELAQAAKDVSNAGILGTISIMIENSGKGAIIKLDSIPKPAEIELPDWLVCFQSFGFALSVNPKNSEKVITAAVVGKVVNEPAITLKNGPESKVLFDLKKDKITGIVYEPNRKSL